MPGRTWLRVGGLALGTGIAGLGVYLVMRKPPGPSDISPEEMVITSVNILIPYPNPGDEATLLVEWHLLSGEDRAPIFKLGVRPQGTEEWTLGEERVSEKIGVCETTSLILLAQMPPEWERGTILDAAIFVRGIDEPVEIIPGAFRIAVLEDIVEPGALEPFAETEVLPTDLVQVWFNFTNKGAVRTNYRFRLINVQGPRSAQGPLVSTPDLNPGESARIALWAYIPHDAVVGYCDAEIWGCSGVTGGCPVPIYHLTTFPDFWYVKEMVPEDSFEFLGAEYLPSYGAAYTPFGQTSTLPLIPYLGPDHPEQEGLWLKTKWRRTTAEPFHGWAYLRIWYPGEERVFEPTPIFVLFLYLGVEIDIIWSMGMFIPDTPGTYRLEAWLAYDAQIAAIHEFTFTVS